MKWSRPIVYGLLILGAAAVAVLVFPQFSGPGEGGRPKIHAKAQITVFETALDIFEVDNGFYPKSLKELVAALPSATNWHGPYLKPAQIPMDPWQHPFLYTYPGKHNPESFDLMSAGPDGQAGTDDDITNWQPKR